MKNESNLIIMEFQFDVSGMYENAKKRRINLSMVHEINHYLSSMHDTR